MAQSNRNVWYIHTLETWNWEKEMTTIKMVNYEWNPHTFECVLSDFCLKLRDAWSFDFVQLWAPIYIMQSIYNSQSGFWTKNVLTLKKNPCIMIF